MNTKAIEFMKIKKVHNRYTQLAHIKRKKIAYKFKNVNVNKKIYRKNNRIIIDVSFDKNGKMSKRINKLKTYTINHVFEQHKEKGATLESIQKNYVDKTEEIHVTYVDHINEITEIENRFVLPIEIHPECKFSKVNQDCKADEDSYKKLTFDDTIDITISFRGIIFGKSNFTNDYIIHNITRHYEETVDLEDCQISDSEDEDIDNDEDKFNQKKKQNFSDLFDEPKKVEPVPEVVKEETEEIVKDTITNIIDVIVSSV